MLQVIKSVSPRNLRRMLLFVAFPLGSILIFVVTIYTSEWVAFLIFVWALILEITDQNLGCPACGHNLGTVGKIYIFPIRSPLTPQKCRHCGHDLTAKPNTADSKSDKMGSVFGSRGA